MSQEPSFGVDLMRTYPGHGWRKALFKAPLYLWRLGLGFFVGRYIMVITTIGRKSGQPRHTMAEWHPHRDSKFVPVAFGEKAQWYKNAMANSHVTIQTADGTQSALARRITDPDELLEAFHTIMKRNPMMAQWYLEAHGAEPTNADVLATKDDIYFLTFDPTTDPTPPPLEADLWWVWPLVLAVFSLLILGSRSARK
ncbi:MAG: nitroreductase family deazaflavin-dependent oxidoreductase [Anaerolineae bacterium]|nr:nitroreductase family deazaflavin-dependent oxidoreductase [Anaerolineae bacterium]